VVVVVNRSVALVTRVCRVVSSKQPKPDHALKAFKYSVMRDEAGRLKFPDAAPDNLALSALFAAMVLRKRGPTIADVNACIELYEMMSEVDEEGNRLFPDVELTDTELFNSLLFIIVKRRLPNDETNKNSVDFRQAKAVFDRAVREYGVKPNLISYNSMIVAASRAVGGADLDAAVELFHETLKFNADGTPKAGDLPDTFVLFARLRYHCISPNLTSSVCFSTPQIHFQQPPCSVCPSKNWTRSGTSFSCV